MAAYFYITWSAWLYGSIDNSPSVLQSPIDDVIFNKTNCAVCDYLIIIAVQNI